MSKLDVSHIDTLFSAACQHLLMRYIEERENMLYCICMWPILILWSCY